MSNIKFVMLGVKNEGMLDFQKPLIYSSDSLISSMSYSGYAYKIKESTTLSDSIKNKLSGINGKVSLGTTGGKLRNAHIYTSKAVRLDGIERLCYVQSEENLLIVKEYSGNRGAKYSAFYSMLRQELLVEGFTEVGNKFKIDENDVSKFVEIINRIIQMREKNMYELVAVKDTDSIIIEKVRYYYFKAYWGLKLSVDEVNEMLPEQTSYDSIDKVENALKILIEYAKNCTDSNELSCVKEKMDKLNMIVTNRIRNLKEIEELSLML